MVHPQHWPEDFEYAGKRVVVVGSGATAITLVPALAESAPTSPCCSARQPTWASAPREDLLAKAAPPFA